MHCRNSLVSFLGLACVLACALGCAGPTAVGVPDRAYEDVAPANAPAPDVWSSKLSVDHPLVGKIWSVSGGRFVDRADVAARATKARFVLLGEKHDNADHHRLQAEMIRAVTAAGRKPAVVFEMIDRSRQPAVDAHLAAAPADVDGLGEAVAWAESGWPAWEIYRPVFAAAVEAGLSVVGAGLPRSEAMSMARGGALPPELAQKLDQPLPEPLNGQLVAELEESHCGYMPKEMLAPMLVVQRARDALMAQALVAHATADGAVLIAGGGHARTDRGAPWYMGQPAGDTLAIGFAEVTDDLTDPAGYAARYDGAIPFDYLWFTPRDNDIDHCKELEERMKKMHDSHGAKPADKPGDTP